MRLGTGNEVMDARCSLESGRLLVLKLRKAVVDLVSHDLHPR